MREILFRGKTIDGDWTYGYYVFTPKRTGMFGQTINEADFDRHYILTMKYNLVKEINPETVGQYTGLTDKNGKKIFEGDIVKTNTGKLYEIKLRKGCWVVWSGAEKLEYHKWDFLNTFAPTVEIIGNIHDNKLEDFENGC